MAEKKEPEFIVSDRRKFTVEGALRDDAVAEQQAEAAPPAPSAAPPAPSDAPPQAAEPPKAEQELPSPPSAEEKQAQEDAYRASTRQMDDQIRAAYGGGAQEFEVTFERFVAQMYMAALVQLGLAHEQGGQPRIDLIGARQTIDSIAMLTQKTKGNLTMQEDNLLQNMLYELRMAYLEVTNAISRAAQTGEPGGPLKR